MSTLDAHRRSYDSCWLACSHSAATGQPTDTIFSQAVQQTGVSAEVANFIDDAISIPLIMGGSAVARSNQLVQQVGKSSLNRYKEDLNFTQTTLSHMKDPNRRIPRHLLKEIIKNPLAIVKDPQKAKNASMYYSQIFRNKKLYNVEVLYNKKNNTIMHFEYSRDPLGPLNKISKQKQNVSKIR